jgi:hypothetical protein
MRRKFLIALAVSEVSAIAAANLPRPPDAAAPPSNDDTGDGRERGRPAHALAADRKDGLDKLYIHLNTFPHVSSAFGLRKSLSKLISHMFQRLRRS